MDNIRNFIINTWDYEAFEAIKGWVVGSGLKIIVIVAVAIMVRKFGHIFIERIIRRMVVTNPRESKDSEEKRESTLIRIVNGTISVVVLLVAFLVVLQELGIEIGPILAAAGIAGLALGFGGQYLIRDIISGLFIILENQYRVGDVACFDGTCGLVEEITLRMTTLRDQDGTVHHVPHGEIKKVANLTKNFSRVNLNIGVAYDSDLEKVIRVVNKVGTELAEDPEWKEFILQAPQFLRVDDFADSAIIIKILGDTLPIKQWDVTGELRKRLKVAFDQEKIEIPFPQVTVHTTASKLGQNNS